MVGVSETDGVSVMVGERVMVGVRLIVGVRVMVGVSVTVEVGGKNRYTNGSIWLFSSTATKTRNNAAKSIRHPPTIRLRRIRKKGNDRAVRIETMPRQIKITISKAVMINAVWTAVWISSDMSCLHP